MATPGSGKQGNLTVDGVQVCPVTNFTAVKTSNNHAYGANDTGGLKKRIAGTKDRNGTFRVNGDPSPVVEGSEYDLNLDNGVSDEDFEIIVDEVRQECDIDDGAPIGWDVTWSGTVITATCSSSG